MNKQEFQDKVLDVITERAKTTYGGLWSGNGHHTVNGKTSFDLTLKFYRQEVRYEVRIAEKEEYQQSEVDGVADYMFSSIPTAAELKKQLVYGMNKSFWTSPTFYDWNKFSDCYPPLGYPMQFKLKSGLEVGPIAIAETEFEAETGRGNQYFIHQTKNGPAIIQKEEVESWKLLYFTTDMIK